MTATTTIRIDFDALPDSFDRSRPEAVADAIQMLLGHEGIAADCSDVISHIKIELPTSRLAEAASVLAALQLL